MLRRGGTAVIHAHCESRFRELLSVKLRDEKSPKGGEAGVGRDSGDDGGTVRDPRLGDFSREGRG